MVGMISYRFQLASLLLFLSIAVASATVVEMANGSKQTVDSVAVSGDKLICQTSFGVLTFKAENLSAKERARYFPSSVSAQPVSPATVVATPVMTPAATPAKIAAKPPVLKSGEEPPFPKESVGSPEFNTKIGKKAAGSAVLARIEGNLYLLTVRHLLGPMGGFPSETKPAEVPGFVKSIELHGLYSGQAQLSGGGIKAARCRQGEGAPT